MTDRAFDGRLTDHGRVAVADEQHIRQFDLFVNVLGEAFNVDSCCRLRRGAVFRLPNEQLRTWIVSNSLLPPLRLSVTGKVSGENWSDKNGYFNRRLAERQSSVQEQFEQGRHAGNISSAELFVRL